GGINSPVPVDVRVENSQQRRGSYGLAAAGLDYSLSVSRTRFGFTVSAKDSTSYNTLVARLINVADATVGASYQISRHTRFSASHRESYQPYYFAGPQVSPATAPEGEPITVPLDTSAILSEYYRTSSDEISLAHNFSRRTTL